MGKHARGTKPLTTWVFDQERTDFRSLAAQHGTTAAVLLRAIVRAVLREPTFYMSAILAQLDQEKVRPKEKTGEIGR
jgi:hypothetical protein